MILPTIHRNGTSADALLEQARAAGDALREALDALQGAAPNARDYYPQGPDAYRAAEAEHAARIGALRRVLADMQALAEHAADAEG